MFVCLFIDFFVFALIIIEYQHESFPQNFVKNRLDLADILRISKLDWRDVGGAGKKGRRGEGEKGRNPSFLLSLSLWCVL